jgi:hypothetical protein
MSSGMKREIEERFRQLLMAAVDGELREQEKKEFDHFIQSDSACAKSWQEYKKLKEVTRTMKLKDPPNETWETYWINIYNKIERGIGWIVFSIGSVILLTYGICQMVQSILADTEMIGIVKVGLFALIAGAVILLVSVIREKVFVGRKDKYREVQR